MSPIPLSFLLLAAASRLVLDDTIEIPRSEWRYVDVTTKEPMAVVNCEYQVASENSPVRIVWIARRSLDTFRSGRGDNILAATTFGMDGKLRHFAAAPGDYAMVIENQPATRVRAKVKVRVWLESPVSPKVLSPQRRLAVILISAVVFLAIVSFSAFKLRGSTIRPT